MNQFSPEFQKIHTRVGERITGQILLSPTEIATFAALCGDTNPLHYDEKYAQQTRFGGLIAGGPQLMSLMIGLIATTFSQDTEMIGLEFAFQFCKAVKAEEAIDVEWEIVSAEPKESLQGEIVTLIGKATNPQGQVALKGTGKILVKEKH